MVPPSPTHRRRQSSTSIHNLPSRSRRSSIYSTPSKRSSRAFGSDALSPLELDSRTLGSSFGVGDGNDLGNLEDELAGAWEEDGQGTEDGESSQLDGGITRSPSSPMKNIVYGLEKIRDSGIDVPSRMGSANTSANTSPTHRRKSSATQPAARISRGHSTSHWEEVAVGHDISKSLQACMREIELLATATSVVDETIEEEPPRDTISGFVKSLQDLGGQHSSLETNTTRLITAHASLATHMAHAVRTIQSLAYHVVSPMSSAYSLEVEEIDATLAILDAAVQALPRPTLDARSGLERLSSTTDDLMASLSDLSDSIHMSRHLTETATRRLKGTRDMVSTIRKELQQADDGRLWIESGDWDQKLADREAATACRDILSGFDKTCDDWRKRLLDSQEAQHKGAGAEKHQAQR